MFTIDGITFSVTRLEGGVLCIMASKMPREIFVRHLENLHTHSSPGAAAVAASSVF
jgi:hypothetical protein